MRNTQFGTRNVECGIRRRPFSGDPKGGVSRLRIVERGVRKEREARLVQALIILLSGMLPACRPSGGNEAGGIHTSAGARDEFRYDKSIAFLKLSQLSPQPKLPAPATSTDQTSDRASKQIESARELFAEDRYAEATFLGAFCTT